MTNKRLGLFAVFAYICIVCGLSYQKNDPPAGVDQKVSSVVLDASKRWFSQKVSDAMDGTIERVKLISNGIIQPGWTPMTQVQVHIQHFLEQIYWVFTIHPQTITPQTILYGSYDHY